MNTNTFKVFNPDSIDFSKNAGLVPVIVQDNISMQVLMQGYMNAEALKITLETGKITFFSRSRNCLWTKGESSGNFLSLTDIYSDCDNDSLLLMASPAGPTCHTGSYSCFGLPEKTNPLFLLSLEQILRKRIEDGNPKSYTVRLLNEGPKKIAKKLGEEAVEVALEAENGTTERLLDEAADLLYHLSVLLLSRGLSWNQIMEALKKRMM